MVMVGLASHCSFTYRKPVGVLGRVLNCFTGCQTLGIGEQYRSQGVRMFELRIWFNEGGELELRHGPVVYAGGADVVRRKLQWMNAKGDCCVRVLLEETKALSQESYASKSEELFRFYCEEISVKYSDILFVGGERVFDGDFVYMFDAGSPFVREAYSKHVCLLPPKWFGRLFNSGFKKGAGEFDLSGRPDCWLMLDRVDLG